MSGVDESAPGADPFEVLQSWLFAAAQAGVGEPAAMCLATADAAGRPSARMVLLRGVDGRGLRFYSSYFSRKGRQLSENSAVASVLYWPALERQVRVEGTARPLPEEDSDEYFAARPRGHRLAAWASEQSDPVESRAVLEERFAHFDARFGQGEVPRPHSWGGYLIVPDRFEFWQGRPNRMHDRFEYLLNGLAWQLRRLQP